MIYSDTHPTTDEYGRIRFANNLADKLLTTEGADNICLALIGPWGNGKTTTLKYLEQALEEKEKIAVSRFSPFMYDTPAELISSFYGTLTDTVGKKDKETARRTGIALKGLSLAAKTAGFAADFLPGGKLASGILDKTGELLSGAGEIAASAERPTKPAEQLLADAHSAMADASTRAVILIDEVDRLMPGEILQLFRLIRMVANFPNTTYVVAFDRQMVVDALAVQFNGARLSASRYLEKIFQAEIPLPFPEKSLIGTNVGKKLDEILTEIGVIDYDTATESEVRRFWHFYHNHFSDAFRNMRVAKRFWSQVHTLLPLVKDDINITDFLITEGFRAADPEGFEAVRASLPKFFFRSMNHETTQKVHTELLVDLSQKVNLPDLEEFLSALFPQLNGYEGHDRDEAARRMSISSRRFASRYFDYSVSRDDISSKIVRDIIKAANNGEAQYLRIKDIVDTKPQAMGRLLEDLEAFASTLSTVEAKVLVRDLIKLMPGLPDPGHLFDSPVMQVATVAARMLNGLPQADKLNLLSDLVLNEESIIGLINLLDWFRPRPHEKGRLTASQWEPLQELIAGRIVTADESQPLHLMQPIGAAKRYYEFVCATGKVPPVADRLEKRLQECPTDVFHLLKHFVGQAHTGQGVHPSDLSRQNYDAVCQVLPSNIIVDAIHSTGQVFYDGDAYPQYDDEEVAHLSNVTGTMQAAQFVWLDRHYSGKTETEDHGDGNEPDDDDRMSIEKH